MDYSVLVEKALSILGPETYIYFLAAAETVFLNYVVAAKPSKYEGGTIVNGEFLKELRKKIPDPVEKNNQKGKLKESVDGVIKHFDLKDLRTFYLNLQTLKTKSTPLSILFGLAGSYNSKKNSLKYSLKGSITHEILHVGSSYYDSDLEVELSGFSQRKKLIRIGDAINEGYTELLASRIEKKKVSSYHSQAKIARMIEFFFDDPREMESLYMNHDLPGLIDHMSKFTSREEFLKLIMGMDLFFPTAMVPIPPLSSISAQLNLYKWFSENCRDEKKVAELRELACKNKIVEAVIKNKEVRLLRGLSSKPINISGLKFEEFDSVPFEVEDNQYLPPESQTNQIELDEEHRILLQERIETKLVHQKENLSKRKVSDLFDGIISVEDYERFANENGMDASKIAEEILNEANRRKLQENNKGRSIA